MSFLGLSLAKGEGLALVALLARSDVRVHVAIGHHATAVVARRVDLDIFLFALLPVDGVRVLEELPVAEVAHDAFRAWHQETEEGATAGPTMMCARGNHLLC